MMPINPIPSKSLLLTNWFVASMTERSLETPHFGGRRASLPDAKSECDGGHRFGALYEEIEMHNIKQASGSMIAADTQDAVNALDMAMITQSRLFATVVETATEAKLPVRTPQKLLQSISAGMAGLVASRADIVTAVTQINMIQMRSNLNATSFGCPKVVEPDGNGSDGMTGQIKTVTEEV